MKILYTVLILGMLFATGTMIVGCGDDDDCNCGQADDGGENADQACDETTSELDGPDDVSALLGVSANDVLDETGGGFNLTAAYSTDTSLFTQSPLGGETELTVTIAYAGGAIREIESTAADGGGAEIYADCRNRLEIEVSVAFTTADGAFEETWSAVLTQSQSPEDQSLDPLALSASFDPLALNGGFAISNIVGPEPDAITGALSSLAVAPFAGDVTIYVEQSYGEGDDATVSQSAQSVLSWGEAAEE
jgi:hypothetical protein